MVMWTKPAGKPADADFWVPDVHWYAFHPGITRYSDTQGMIELRNSKNYVPDTSSAFSLGKDR
jgi:hypothetical protein